MKLMIASDLHGSAYYVEALLRRRAGAGIDPRPHRSVSSFKKARNVHTAKKIKERRG